MARATCVCGDVSEHKSCESLWDVCAHKIWDGCKPATPPEPYKVHSATGVPKTLVFPSSCPTCPAGRWCHPSQGLWG